MTAQPASGDLGRAFRVSSGAGAYQQFLFRQQEEERQRRERKEDVRNDETEFFDLAMSIISDVEMTEFRAELDLYDTATVATLQENETELAQVRERMDELLGQAYVLPDGRRVFKTEDGLRVFDEHGTELDASTIDPDMIGDDRPHWETYQPHFERAQELTAERKAILAYQEKLDEARERLDAGDLTREEFDELRDALKADMPGAVRAQNPDLAGEQQPAHDAAEAQPAPLDISDDMTPTVAASRAAIPGLTG